MKRARLHEAVAWSRARKQERKWGELVDYRGCFLACLPVCADSQKLSLYQVVRTYMLVLSPRGRLRGAG